MIFSKLKRRANCTAVRTKKTKSLLRMSLACQGLSRNVWATLESSLASTSCRFKLAIVFLRNWLSSGSCDGGLGSGNQIKTEFGRFALEMGQFPLSLLSFIALSADLVKGDFVLEHKVDGASDLVSGGNLGLSRPNLGAFEAEKSPKSRVGASHGSGGLTKGLASPVVGFEGAGAQDFAPGNVIVGGQPQPGTEMVDIGEAGHLGVNFGDNGLGQGGAQTGHGHQINPDNTKQLVAGAVGGLILGAGGGFDRGQLG
jgi:hypothetical protein